MVWIASSAKIADDSRTHRASPHSHEMEEMAGTLSVTGSRLFDLIPAFLKMGGYRASLYVMSHRYQLSGGPMQLNWDGSMVTISDRDYSLTLPSFRRIPRYRRGIGHRINRLANRYGCKTHYRPKVGDTVVDVGANIGEFTLYSVARGARVVALEPDPWVFKCLIENLGRFPGAVGLPLALWNERGTLSFFSAADKADSSLIEPKTPIRKVVDTEVCPLDEVSEIAALDRIDFLKIDGEGSEPEILEGAAATLGKVRRIGIDIGPERHGESTKDQVTAILESVGFRILHHFHRHALIAENPRCQRTTPN